MTPIAAAVSPMKEAAVARSVAAATQRVTEVLRALEAVEMQIDAYAPYPNSGVGRVAYKQALAKRHFAESITTYTEGSSRPGARLPRKHSETNVARFMLTVAEIAGSEFDAYVEKLEGKVGECAAAEVRGYVWDGSILTVTKADGSVERWSTQMIVNCSVLGKLFNQWPTRKLA